MTLDSNQVLVLLPEFGLPNGFSPSVVEMLLPLPFGFPETQPDMFWVPPWVTLHGAIPQNADQTGEFLGRTWQRFSRHLPQGSWRPGIDNLQSWVTAITRMLAREAVCSRLAA